MSALHRLGDLVEERILSTAKVGQKLADAVEEAIRTHKAVGGGNLSTAESLVRSLTQAVISETLLRDVEGAGHKALLETALLSAYAQVRAEALLADSRVAILSAVPPTPSMLSFLNCVDRLCDQVEEIDESHIRCVLQKLVSADSLMGAAFERVEVYTVSRRARLHSLLRRAVCQLAPISDAERPITEPASAEVAEAPLDGLARALGRLRRDMSRGGRREGLPLRLDWDSPSLLQASTFARYEPNSCNMELASLLHIEGAGISSVCGRYSLVEQTKDRQCEEHPDAAAGGAAYHLPTSAASANDSFRTSWTITYRHDHGPAQILRCSVNLPVPAPGIAFERWCIVDDAARRVLYTAVAPTGAQPPDYGWRPTSSAGWPPPTVRVAAAPDVIIDDSLPCPGLGSDGQSADPLATPESPVEQQDFAVAVTASEFTANEAEGVPSVLVIDYRLQSYDCERVTRPVALPTAASGRPRPRSARIRDYRRSASTDASSQGSIALVGRERRRCRSLETQAGGSGSNLDVERVSQGLAGTGANEDERDLPLSEVMEELRNWQTPAQGDWGPMPQFSGLELYLSTTINDRGEAKGGSVRQDQLAALYERQCSCLAEQEAALRRQLQEASGQDGRAAASRAVKEFILQAWERLEQHQTAAEAVEGRRQGGVEPSELRWESLTADVWDRRLKSLSQQAEHVQEEEGGEGSEGRATGVVQEELPDGPREINVPESVMVEGAAKLEQTQENRGSHGPQDGAIVDTHLVQAQAGEVGHEHCVREANGYAVVDLLGVDGGKGKVLSTLDIEVCGIEWEGTGRGGGGRMSPVVSASATCKTLQTLYLIRVTSVETDDQRPGRSTDRAGRSEPEASSCRPHTSGVAPCAPSLLLRHRVRVLRKPLSAVMTLHENLEAVLVAAESRLELPSPPLAHIKEFEATHARHLSDPFSFPSLSSSSAKARASCMQQLQDYLQALLRLLVTEASSGVGQTASLRGAGTDAGRQAGVLTEMLGLVRCFFAAAAEGSTGTQQDLIIGWTVDKEVEVNSALRESLFRTQGGRCRGCGAVLSSTSFLGIGKDYMTCRFLGALFCTNVCYADAPPARIPADIVRKWDFTRRKVCLYSARYLSAMASQPIVHVADFTPSLLTGNSTIKYARQLREQLRDLRAVADKSQCREAQGMLQPLTDSRPHLMLDQEVFSLEDLVELQRGTLADALTTLVESLNDHVVEDCSVCRTRGCSTCQVCGHPEPLFPHQLWKVVACTLCGRVFHKACMRGRDLRHGCQLCNIGATSPSHPRPLDTGADASHQEGLTPQGGALPGSPRSSRTQLEAANAETCGGDTEQGMDYTFSFD